MTIKIFMCGFREKILAMMNSHTLLGTRFSMVRLTILERKFPYMTVGEFIQNSLTVIIGKAL